MAAPPGPVAVAVAVREALHQQPRVIQTGVTGQMVLHLPFRGPLQPMPEAVGEGQGWELRGLAELAVEVRAATTYRARGWLEPPILVVVVEEGAIMT